MKALLRVKLIIGNFTVYAGGLYFNMTSNVHKLSSMLYKDNTIVEVTILDLDTNLTDTVYTFDEFANLLLEEDFLGQIVEGNYKFIYPFSDIAIKAIECVHFCYEIDRNKVNNTFDELAEVAKLSFYTNSLDRANMSLTNDCKNELYYIGIAFDYCKRFFEEGNRAGMLIETDELSALCNGNFIDWVLNNREGVLWKGDYFVSLRCRSDKELNGTKGILCYFRFDKKFLKYLLIN